MPYHHIITYTLTDKNKIFKTKTIVLQHTLKCTNTTIKNFIRRNLPPDEKQLEINIIENELISEEEAIGKYGNSLLQVNIKRRFR